MSIIMSGLSFSDALQQMKAGYRISRAGWNGKGMWLTISPGGEIGASDFWAPANKAFAVRRGGSAIVRPYITMKTAEDDIVPWVPSQVDVLADDWVVLE